MDLSALLGPLCADRAIGAAVEHARAHDLAELEIGAPRPLRPVIAAALAAAGPGAARPVLAVTATDREASDLADALTSLLPPDSVAEYPAWETLPHERLSPRADTVGRRLAIRRRLRHPVDPASPRTGVGGALRVAGRRHTGPEPAAAAGRRAG